VTHLPDRDAPADRLKAVARTIARLAPSRTDPERYHIEKSEALAELRQLARELEICPPPLRPAYVPDTRELAGTTGPPETRRIASMPSHSDCKHCRRRQAQQSRRHRLRLPAATLFDWAAMVLP
jgi:hypothetical protein